MHMFTIATRSRGGMNPEAKVGRVVPLTENGVVRIMSNSSYAGGAFKPIDVIQRIDLFILGSDHEFWPDDVSIRDARTFDHSNVTGAGITDMYLLALAVCRKARFVTFDQRVPIKLVPSAARGNLFTIQ